MIADKLLLKKYLTLGLAIILSDPNPELLRPVGTVGMAVTLAAVIPVQITVKPPATVRPAGELRIVKAATAGTVKGLKVKEN